MKYDDISDEELVVLAKSDVKARETIIGRYAKDIESYCKSKMKGDVWLDDIWLEGVVALNKAIDTFDSKNKSGASFKTFSSTCYKNKIRSSLKSKMIKSPLKSCIYFSEESDDEEEPNVVIADDKLTPEEEYISNESLSEFTKKIKEKLSKLENEVLDLMIKGCTNREIAQYIKKDEKSLDNTKQRLRKKILDMLKK